MRRRTFLRAAALSAAPVPPGLALGAAPAAAPPGADRLLFFDDDCLAEHSEVVLVPPPLEKLGPLLEPDMAGDSAGVSTAMGSGFMPLGGGRMRLYYTSVSRVGPERGIAVAESEDGLHWTRRPLGQVRVAGSDTNRLAVEGLPEGSHVLQPSLVRLGDGRWRIYAWLGRSKPRILRYVALESADGLRWRAINVESPCLRHPLELSPMGGWSWLDGPECERLWREAGGRDLGELDRWKRLRSNDATHTYARPEGGFEMFSVWALPNRPGNLRRVEADNARAIVRVLHRRTSDDGLSWSDPELILVPDEHDAWDQQFYYLAQHRLAHLRIGFLGRYRVVDQDMDIELACSLDGRHWRRPMRGAWLPRGPAGAADSVMVYMPSHLIDGGDHWLGLYSAVDAKHNAPREARRGSVHGVRIPRYRFAGLASKEGLSARVRTRPLVSSRGRFELDAAIDGALRAELCDAFGQPLPGLSFADAVTVRGDRTNHVLAWRGGEPVGYRYDAVTLRMEWSRGVVYGVSF